MGTAHHEQTTLLTEQTLLMLCPGVSIEEAEPYPPPIFITADCSLCTIFKIDQLGKHTPTLTYTQYKFYFQLTAKSENFC